MTITEIGAGQVWAAKSSAPMPPALGAIAAGTSRVDSMNATALVTNPPFEWPVRYILSSSTHQRRAISRGRAAKSSNAVSDKG